MNYILFEKVSDCSKIVCFLISIMLTLNYHKGNLFYLLNPPHISKCYLYSSVKKTFLSTFTHRKGKSSNYLSLLLSANMSLTNMKTFYYDLYFRDLLDGEGKHPFVESVYLSINEENILWVHNGAGLNHWLFTLDHIPNNTLYSNNIKSASYFF